jgi:hypothetical protein
VRLEYFKAAEHHEKFLPLLKDADSSIAEVDARKRMAGLKSI